MNKGSLRLRLFSAAAVLIALALFLTGLAIVQLFERQVRQQVLSDIDNHLLQLAGSVEIAGDGGISAGSVFADSRFEEPFGGRYWRIDFINPNEASAHEPLRSRSLWDADFDPSRSTGPQGEPLIMSSRQITIDSNGQTLRLWLHVGVSEEEASVPIVQLRDQLALSLGLIGIVLTFGAWIQVTVGLSPLQTLRRQLGDVRSGHASRLTGEFPLEVAPLVRELNDVLDAQEKSTERARRRAGDLAHGLKTPLTVLSVIARDIRKRDLGTRADEIDDQAETMRLHVERALARARLATGRGRMLIAFRPAAEKVITTMKRLPRGSEITWELAVAKDAALPMETDDITELLGNLLDNARKWAKSRIRLRYAAPLLVIEDDGPGVAEAELGLISKRGEKLDESRQGSGLGLSIVEDIADIYGLKVNYGRSELGGLKVEIRI